MIFCSDLAIECFEKARRSRPLKPLQALKDFRIIYEASGKGFSDGRGEKSPTRFGGGQAAHDRPKFQSPVRRARSLSPVKDCGAAASRDATRGKATTTAVPKSTSMYPCQSGKEKRSLQESAGVKSDAAKQVPETASTTRMRQGRRVKEVGGNVSGDSKDDSAADETMQRTMQTDSTRGKSASTSAKPAVTARQSHGTSKEPQLQKRRATVDADSTDDNPSLPNRGS